jgi:tRNA (guanine37-N1)-methyltransferase
MVMRPEPWGEALDEVLGSVTGGGNAAPGDQLTDGPHLIVPTPAGALFTQATAAELATASHLVFACGRYEGIDARVADYARGIVPVHELSIGDYVLAGGEPAVLVMVEAICRLLPGVLGNAESAPNDSFGGGVGPMHGLVEGPSYTRPRVWRGREVPEILLSGNHADIARWRRDQALVRTALTRPDLAARLPESTLSARDRKVLSRALATMWHTKRHCPSSEPWSAPSRGAPPHAFAATQTSRSALVSVRMTRTRTTGDAHRDCRA